MIGLIIIPVAAVVVSGLYVINALYEYYRDSKRLRRFHAVSISALTNAWMVLQQYFHTRTLAIDEAHRKYGKIVRIGPSHVSMASLQAIKDIYGHGTPATKDNFYGAFVSTHLNISDSQDKTIHNLKRKRFAVAFAQKSITELEYVVNEHLRKLVARLDAKASTVPRETTDFRLWMTLLTYDITSVLLYSHSLNFLDQGNTITTAETISGKLYKADVDLALRESLRISTSLGWAPRRMVLAKMLTKWHRGWKHGAYFRDVNIHLLRQRLQKEKEEVAAGRAPPDDLFTTLMWNRDHEPLGLEFGELLTESSNLLNAGSENVEISITNTIYYLVRNPRTATALREELNAYCDSSNLIPAYEEIKDLPYLRGCIDESLRLSPALPGGLPRVVPSAGMFVGGEWMEGNTTISVSTYTMHRDPDYFPSPDEYRPERWLESGAADLQRVFLPFQQGGRACIGRNIAYLTMQMTIATLFLRYDFALLRKDWTLKTRETISGHTDALPLNFWVREIPSDPSK